MPDPKRHDPLCPRHRWHNAFYVTCQCNLIREVGERIAQRIEVDRVENSESVKSGSRLDKDFNLGKVFAFERSARIARWVGLDG